MLFQSQSLSPLCEDINTYIVPYIYRTNTVRDAAYGAPRPEQANSELHTEARPSVRLCVGPELSRCVHMKEFKTTQNSFKIPTPSPVKIPPIRHQSESSILRSAYSGFCWIPSVVRRLFEVNSEPHTGARPSVRLCVGLMKIHANMRRLAVGAALSEAG